jgi:hypothetical protein
VEEVGRGKGSWDVRWFGLVWYGVVLSGRVGYGKG